VLLTSLPVDTVEEVELIIDCYRRRWLIEEYNSNRSRGVHTPDPRPRK
jgi:hypothetical protein